MSRPSASWTTPRSSWATWSSSSCRRSAATWRRTRTPRWSNPVKAASEIYAPVSGEIVEVNEALADDPAQVNADPYGVGWFMKIRLDDPAELEGLMDEEAYKDCLADLE